MKEPVCCESACEGCVCGAFKGYKEGIALSIDFIAVPLLKCHAQQMPTLFQYTGILLTEALQ